jgi:UDP-N-acetylmuramate--alanine ligase
MTLTLDQLREKSIHFVGMGGAGMSGIARILLAQGAKVSGSDAKDSMVLQGLVALGAKAYVGHSAEHLAGIEVVVLSSAIDARNPEVQSAKELGLIILGRAQALALLMSESVSVAVAGTHGKTTTTSMLTVALQKAALDPSFAIGGMINSSGTNAHLGSGDIFVVEADESDGSFLAYKPNGAIITNMELDHVDHFPDFNSVLAAFHQFVDSIKPEGFLIACIDSPGVQQLLSEVNRTDLRIITYGQSAEFSYSHLSVRASESSARIARNGRVLGELELSIPGEHNVMNAIAALSAGLELGADLPSLMEGLRSFSGARRRFEVKGSVAGITVIDDYGHHPTEVRVTLETAKRYAGNGKVLAIFQPHRYSRTQAFLREFSEALDLADATYLLEIYPASEAPIPGVSSKNIAELMKQEKAHFEPNMLQIVSDVVSQAESGDLILTLGAGDVNSLAPVILQALHEKYA